MTKETILAALLLITGCTVPQREEARRVGTEACVIDRAGQPIIVPLEGVASMVEPLSSIPIMVLHNGTQIACRAVLPPS